MNLRNINNNSNAKIIKKELEDLNLNYSILKEEIEQIKYEKNIKIDAEYKEALTHLNTKHNNELHEIQRKCNHKWVEDGRDSHKTYYACSICGISSSD